MANDEPIDDIRDETSLLKLDHEALRAMTPDQRVDFLMRMMGDILSRINDLEKDLAGADDDQIEIEGDEEVVQTDRIGNKINIQFDADAAREQIGMTGGGGGSASFAPVRWFRIVTTNPEGTVDGRGNPVKWNYAMQQLKPGATQTDDWENDADGYIGAGRNAKEINNTGVGVQGNGIDIDGTIFVDNPNLMMQPIKDIVPGWLVTYQNGDTECQFAEPNAIDGNCGSGS